MANDLSAVTPKLLAQGVMALRQNAILPQLVNASYEALAGEKGTTIDVPIPSPIAIQNVAPANIPPFTADIGPTSVPVSLANWIEAPFYLTDKDVLTAMNGTIPMQASEAIKSVANSVSSTILALGASFFGISGIAGTTPFTPASGFSGSTWDPRDASNLAARLNQQLAPPDDRHCVMGVAAQANALNLRAFSDMSWTGDADAIIKGRLNERLGFNWWMTQLIQNWTTGTATGITLTTNSVVGQGNAYPTGYQGTVGDATTTPTGTPITLEASGAGTLLVGDILTFAGDPQTYVVTGTPGGSYSLSSSNTNVYIYPGLQVAQPTATGTPVVATLTPAHVMNLGFHRNAIAFATRPLKNVEPGLGAITEVAVDEISKLALRLEVTREFKRTRFSYDILFGCQVIRPELGARLLG